MGEVKAQFQTMYNSGFRDGWKSALNKVEVPRESELFLWANTPLPYPIAGLKDTDEEDEDEDEEGREAQVEQDNRSAGLNAESISGTIIVPEANSNPWSLYLVKRTSCFFFFFNYL